MDFRTLLQHTDWSGIEEALNDIGHAGEKSYFKKVYFRLLGMDPKTSDERVTIVIDEEGDVVGRIGDEVFAIGLSPWAEWLSYEIEKGSFTNGEFVAHCLYEMTFYGSESDKQAFLSEAEEIAEQLDPKDGAFMRYKKRCPFCQGTKVFLDEACKMCDVNGEINMARTLR